MMPPSLVTGPAVVTLIGLQLPWIPTSTGELPGNAGALRSNARCPESPLISSLGVLGEERLKSSVFIKGKRQRN